MPFAGCTSTLRAKEDCDKSHKYVQGMGFPFLQQNALTAPSAQTYVRKLFQEAPHAKEHVKGKLAVVTGVTVGGAGFHVCEELALQAEMHVVLMGRSEAKLKDAIAAVEKEAEKRGCPKPTLYETKYDGDDLETVVAAAEFTTKLAKEQYEGKLYVLVNNAGATAPKWGLGKQGAEVQTTRNFLAPHLLTEKLLPVLKSAASTSYPAYKPRVVNVTSCAHATGPDADPGRFEQTPAEGGSPEGTFKDVGDGKLEFVKSMDTVVQYGRAKMMLTADTIALSKKHPELNFTSQQPGSIRSNFGAELGIAITIFNTLFYVFQYSPTQGSTTSLRAALDPDFNTEQDLQGVYLHADGNPWYPADPQAVDPSTKAPYKMDAYAEAWNKAADTVIAKLLP